MNTYSSVVFLHVVGAVAMFAALAVEAVSLARLRVATAPGDARASIRAVPARAGPIAMLATLLSGGWLMSRSWGVTAWLVLAAAVLAGLVASARLPRSSRYGSGAPDARETASSPLTSSAPAR